MYEKNVQLIRYNSHNCYVANIHAFFKVFRCPPCDTYFQKTGNLERHFVRCSERVNLYTGRKIQNTETKTWIGKHIPISVSVSSNLISMPELLCNSNPRVLVESFIDVVEGSATQSKAQMKLKFLEVETAMKSKLTRTPESLNERRCSNQRVFQLEDQCFEDDNEEKDVSRQFLQRQKY